jgi:hypothetical protein
MQLVVERMLKSKNVYVRRCCPVRVPSGYGNKPHLLIWALQTNGKLHNPNTLSILRAPDTRIGDLYGYMITNKKVPSSAVKRTLVV